MNLINEEAATYEGVVDEERNVALVQWSQFIEHDLVKTVFSTMSTFSNLLFFNKNDSFLDWKNEWIIWMKVMEFRLNVARTMQQTHRQDIAIQLVLHF